MSSPALSPPSDEALLRRLAEVVAFDTQNPSGDEAPMAAKLADDLRALGAAQVIHQAVDRHAWVYARFGAAAPRLLVNAHIDTVPRNAGYTRPSHQVTVESGRAYGLGTCDTKGAIAASLEAIASLRAAGRACEGFAVLFSGDEERNGTCVRDFLKRGLAAGVTRAVACEPTSCRVGIRHRGIAAAVIGATSPGGHSARADDLPAPIAILARAAVALDNLAREHRLRGPEGFRGLCLNIASIDGGLAFNVIPARAELSYSFRPAPGADVGALLAETEAAARVAAAPAELSFRVDHRNPPFASKDASAFPSLLNARGGAPIDLAFWTEAALFADAGINAVVFGPGRIDEAHGPDEYVEIADLVTARDAFVDLFSTAPAS